MPCSFLDSPCYGELERKMVQIEELVELQTLWSTVPIGMSSDWYDHSAASAGGAPFSNRRTVAVDPGVNRLNRGKIVFARRETHNIEAKQG